MPAETLAVDVGFRRDLTTLSGLIGAYLDRQLDAILQGDVALRCGADAVHATRVATRRYRSVLRVFREVLPRDRAAALDIELAWFAAALGEVRDPQVLRVRLNSCLAELSPELVVGPVAARIDELLVAEQAHAEADLAATMRTRRYAVLLTELHAWRDHLPISRDAAAADVARFVVTAQAEVSRRLLAADGDDVRLHRARRAAKRARYAAELSQPATGQLGRDAAQQLEEIQRRLGEHQDGVVAAEFLRRAARLATAAGENARTYELLYERERARG